MAAQNNDSTPPRRPIILIFASCGFGSGHKAAEKGPAQLLQAGLAEMLMAQVVMIEPTKPMIEISLSNEEREASIMEIANRVATAVTRAIEDGLFPVVIGGDHTSAIGFHSGLAQAYGQTGIVWIDTHPDLNTPETSPSGNIHGMVLAGLLGRGSEAMLQTTKASQTLDEHVALVGIRSIDDGEQRWIDEGRISCMGMNEVNKRGLKDCLADAAHTANQAKAGFGLTIDLDAIDPSQAPFVATPVDGGIEANELASLLATLPSSDRLLGMEVTEFTPRSSADAIPACQLVAQLVTAIMLEDV